MLFIRVLYCWLTLDHVTPNFNTVVFSRSIELETAALTEILPPHHQRKCIIEVH